MKTLGIITLLLLCLGSSTSSIENPCGIMTPRGGDQNWGEGAYYIPEEFQVDVYDHTFVKKIGTLHKEDSYLYLFDNANKKSNFSHDDIEWIGHYVLQLLKYRSCSRSDFINVLWKSAPNKYYIKKKDLIALNVKPQTYKEFLFSDTLCDRVNSFKSTATLGVNLTKNCLNLREGPSTQSKKIRCVPGNDWDNGELVELKILDHEGNWAKVVVITYKILENDKNIEGPDDCNFSEKNRQYGWVKAIDDTGFPNIWFDVTSY
jgi:hypothetical protein